MRVRPIRGSLGVRINGPSKPARKTENLGLLVPAQEDQRNDTYGCRNERYVLKHNLRKLLWYFPCGWLLLGSSLTSDFGDVRNRVDSHTKSHFKARVYRSLSEWEDRREELKRQILVSAGLLPLPKKTPLSPRRFTSHVYENYAIEKVVIETFPGFYLAGNLYLPLDRPGPKPGILVAHGHWKNGRVH